MSSDGEGGAGETSVGQAVRRGWPIIVVLALAALAASLFATSRRDTTYEAAARLLVVPLSQGDASLFGTDLIRDAGDSSETASTVAALLDSPQAAAETAREIGGGWSAEDVSAAVEIEPVETTQVLAVKAVDENPRAAAAVATEYARSIVRLRQDRIVPQLERRLESLLERRRDAPLDDYSQRDRLFTEIRLLEGTLANGGDPTLRFAGAADVPTATAMTSRLLIAVVALLGGVALGLVAAIAIDRLRRTVRTEHELVAAHPVPVLARLPKRGSNRRPLAPDGMHADGQHEIRGLAAQLERLGAFDERVVVVTSASRGDGRTTIATNLAVALAASGHNTIVVDLDPLSQFIGESLAGAGQVKNLRVERPPATNVAVRERIEAAKDAGDWVVVHAPPVLEGAEALQAAGEADDLIMVARLEHTDRRDYARALAMLERTGAPLTGLVVTASHSRAGRKPPAGAGGPVSSRVPQAPVEEAAR